MTQRPVYQSKSDADLEQLAQDIWAGRIFTSMHVPPEMLRSVFMVAALMEPEDLKAMERDEVTLLYEYISEAGSLSVNGYPAFLSLNVLNKADHTRLLTRLREIAAFFEGRAAEAPAEVGGAS